MEYDVIIVGGGPAGAMAGVSAGKVGVKVLLLEEDKEVGIPLACGEGVSKKRLEEFVKVKENWIATKIEGAKFYSPSGRSFWVKYPEVGYILERKIFDRDLIAMACNEGVEVKVGTKVVGLSREGVKTTRGEIKGKIIIGADGVKGRIGKWAGIDTTLTSKDFWIGYELLLGGVDVKVGEIEFYFGREIAPGGYGWVFPKGEGLANVGVGVYPLLANERVTKYLKRLIKKRFKTYSVLGEYVSIIPTKILKNLVNNNVCVVGDSGRLVDPISGGGIGNALLSGKIAGEVAGESIKRGEIRYLKEYEKRWFSLEGRNMRFRMKVRDVFMKLKDEDLEILFDFGERNFGNKTINEINEMKIIRGIIKFSPKLFKLGVHLLR